jgi:hypothetical protein
MYTLVRTFAYANKYTYKDTYNYMDIDIDIFIYIYICIYIYNYIYTLHLVGGAITILKNDGVRQWAG